MLFHVGSRQRRLRPRPITIHFLQEPYAITLSLLDDPDSLGDGQRMMSPRTMQTHLTAIASKKSAEAKIKVMTRI